MAIRPKLFQQGLILVVVQMLFELAFICKLSALLNEAEQDILAESHSLALINNSHHLLHLFGQTGLASHLYFQSRDQTMLNRFNRQIHEIEDQLGVLDQLVKGNAEEAAREKKLHDVARRALATLQESTAIIMRESLPSYIRSELRVLAKDLDSEVDRFVKDERRIQQEAPVNQAHSRQEVVKFLYCGLICNILLGIALAFYFARGTTDRLDRLVNNSRRLANNEELLPALGGNDEIAELDSVFHDMVGSLKAASQRKQELMQMVSHDLRTPLAAIQVSLETLSQGVFGSVPEKALKEVSICEYNASRLVHLVGDLLDIDRLEAGKLEMNRGEIEIAGVLQESVRVVKAYADRRRIAVVVQPTEAKVFADSERLVQVIVNLLSNAIKYSPKDSHINMITQEFDGTVEVRVNDEGRGIPAEFVKPIFDRFAQVRADDGRRGHGSGLGLAICKAIIEGHGGKIGVDSTEGKGSSFWLRLPPPVKEVKD